jgi:hypothetical protein
MTNRKNVIVLIELAEQQIIRIVVYGNFKKCCLKENFPYHTLKICVFPIYFKGNIIYKQPFY